MNDKIKKSIQDMAAIVTEMVDITYRGFKQNDIHILDDVLGKETSLDSIEEEVICEIVELSKNLDEPEKQKLVVLGQVAQNLERIGDEFRSLIERIEIKISDKLEFSEAGAAQYKEVFKTMKKSVDLMVEFLNTDRAELLDAVLANGDEIKKLVEDARSAHLERLTKGICQARASNMYFDMLDFTGNIARHCTNIARISKEQ